MRDLFLKDLRWKLFAVLLAGFIWLTVHKLIEEPPGVTVSSASSLVTYSNLPVFFISPPADMSQYHVQPDTVAVTVSGPTEIMGVLEPGQIRATVDLTDVDSRKDSDRRVDVSVPPGVTLFNVEPPKVQIIVAPKPKESTSP